MEETKATLATKTTALEYCYPSVEILDNGQEVAAAAAYLAGNANSTTFADYYDSGAPVSIGVLRPGESHVITARYNVPNAVDTEGCAAGSKIDARRVT